MNVHNFIVRPQRQAVERYAKAAAWDKLGADDFEVLAARVAPLPSQQADDDEEEAKRFDMLLLRAQLSILQARPDFMGLRGKIQAIASDLEDQVAVPAIKAEAALIHAVAGDAWWEDVTVPMLETVRRRLRALVKLLPKGQKKIVYTDFQDELGEAVAVELPVIEELTQTGVMDLDRQFQSPFTDFSAQGPLGLFPPTKVAEMVGVLERISLQAVA